MGTWRCGDCGHTWPKSVPNCRRPFDDYLSLHGGSIGTALLLAVEKATAPHITAAERHLRTQKPSEWLGFPLAA